MKLTLFAVTGKNGFCGSMAIATVLGIDTDHAATVVRSIEVDEVAHGRPNAIEASAAGLSKSKWASLCGQAKERIWYLASNETANRLNRLK